MLLQKKNASSFSLSSNEMKLFHSVPLFFFSLVMILFLFFHHLLLHSVKLVHDAIRQLFSVLKIVLSTKTRKMEEEGRGMRRESSKGKKVPES